MIMNLPNNGLLFYLLQNQIEQSLIVDTKNRGGLWKVNEKAVNIFMACERNFFSVQECTINKIDAKSYGGSFNEKQSNKSRLYTVM